MPTLQIIVKKSKIILKLGNIHFSNSCQVSVKIYSEVEGITVMLFYFSVLHHVIIVLV